MVASRLRGSGSAPEPAVDIQPIRTSGDRIVDRPLSEVGGKGLFTKELDEALLSGTVDLAVHSAKDLPTRLPDGIVIAACLEREDVRDAFLSPVAGSLMALPDGSTIGSSSLRRRAMALHLRPDLRVVDLRGNVDTRLRKLAEGQADATFLAMAGLNRLGLAGRATSALAVDDWPPAVGQGIIAITARADDGDTFARLAALDDRRASVALRAERAYLTVLDGSCRTPIGGYAYIVESGLAFDGIIVKPDGSAAHRVSSAGPFEEPEALGEQAAETLLSRAGSGFL